MIERSYSVGDVCRIRVECDSCWIIQSIDINFRQDSPAIPHSELRVNIAKGDVPETTDVATCGQPFHSIGGQWKVMVSNSSLRFFSCKYWTIDVSYDAKQVSAVYSPILDAEQLSGFKNALRHAMIIALPHLKLFGIHCSCVAFDTRAILICGGEGSGKSSLSFGLAGLGLDFISDDRVFVQVCGDTLVVHPSFDNPSCRRSTTELIPEIRHLRTEFPQEIGQESWKVYFDAAKVFSNLGPKGMLTPGLVVLSELVGGSSITIEKVSSIDAVSTFVRENINQAYPAEIRRDLFLVLKKLGSQVGCWHTKIGTDKKGSLQEACAAIRDLAADPDTLRA